METSELAPDVSQLQTDQPQSDRSVDPKNVAPSDTPDSTWVPDNGRRVTLEEYWEKWYENPYPDLDVSYEWNNGILEAKPLPNAPKSACTTGSSPSCSATWKHSITLL